MALIGRTNVEKLRDKRDAKGLAKLLKPGSRHPSELQVEAAAALGEIGDQDAIGALLDAALDWAIWLKKGDVKALDKQVSAAAARALGAIGPHAVRPLVGALAEPDPRFAGAAAEALGEIGWRDDGVPEVLAQLEQQMTALVAVGKQKLHRDEIHHFDYETLKIAHEKVETALERLGAARHEAVEERPPPEEAETHRPGAPSAYLVLLWNARPWSSAEQEEIVATKRAELGCDAELLTTVEVQGPMPTEPDTFVTATALLACKEHGIEFDSERDTISYKGGEQAPGVGLGLVTILVNRSS